MSEQLTGQVDFLDSNGIIRGLITHDNNAFRFELGRGKSGST